MSLTVQLRALANRSTVDSLGSRKQRTADASIGVARVREGWPLGCYLIPGVDHLADVDAYFIPWLWLFAGWGIVTGLLWRMTRATVAAPSAFPVVNPPAQLASTPLSRAESSPP